MWAQWQDCHKCSALMQGGAAPNLQNLGRACSEAIGQPHDRYQDRYTDMDRAASMDGPYKQYLPAGRPQPHVKLAHPSISHSSPSHRPKSTVQGRSQIPHGCCVLGYDPFRFSSHFCLEGGLLCQRDPWQRSVLTRPACRHAGIRPRSPSTTLSRAFSSDQLCRSPTTSPLPGSPTQLRYQDGTPPGEEAYPSMPSFSWQLPPVHPSSSAAGTPGPTAHLRARLPLIASAACCLDLQARTCLIEVI